MVTKHSVAMLGFGHAWRRDWVLRFTSIVVAVARVEQRISVKAKARFTLIKIMASKITPLSTPFTTQVVDEDPSNPRAVRRIVVNAEVLKSHKISAGDVLLLSSHPGGIDKVLLYIRFSRRFEGDSEKKQLYSLKRV